MALSLRTLLSLASITLAGCASPQAAAPPASAPAPDTAGSPSTDAPCTFERLKGPEKGAAYTCGAVHGKAVVSNVPFQKLLDAHVTRVRSATSAKVSVSPAKLPGDDIPGVRIAIEPVNGEPRTEEFAWAHAAEGSNKLLTCAIPRGAPTIADCERAFERIAKTVADSAAAETKAKDHAHAPFFGRKIAFPADCAWESEEKDGKVLACPNARVVWVPIGLASAPDELLDGFAKGMTKERPAASNANESCELLGKPKACRKVVVDADGTRIVGYAGVVSDAGSHALTVCSYREADGYPAACAAVIKPSAK